jgi:hypothetical protein
MFIYFAVSIASLDFIYLSPIKCPSISNTIPNGLLHFTYSQVLSKKY